MESPARKVLAQNLKRLMEHHPDLGTEKLLRKKARIGGGQLDVARMSAKEKDFYSRLHADIHRLQQSVADYMTDSDR